jgi:uncharacterized protein (TIGR00369 family)
MNLLEDIGAHLTGLEQLRVMKETGRRPGFAQTLDIDLIEVEEGCVVVESTPGVHVYNPNGTVHGGFAATMLDFACGYAVLSQMRPDQAFATLELKVAYHKAMTHETGPVRAEGRVVTIGRRAAFTEAKLTGVTGILYATATSTLLVMSRNTHTPASESDSTRR